MIKLFHITNDSDDDGNDGDVVDNDDDYDPGHQHFLPKGRVAYNHHDDRDDSDDDSDDDRDDDPRLGTNSSCQRCDWSTIRMMIMMTGMMTEMMIMVMMMTMIAMM